MKSEAPGDARDLYDFTSNIVDYLRSLLTFKCFFIHSLNQWFSGRVLACHAGSPGSFPCRCRRIWTRRAERIQNRHLISTPPTFLSNELTGLMARANIRRHRVAYMLLNYTHDKHRSNDSSEGVRDPALADWNDWIHRWCYLLTICTHINMIFNIWWL